MLYLTYNNTAHMDGFGSQLQRMLSVYCVAKETGAAYIHSGFHDIQYQGLKCLEENKTDDEFVATANRLFKMEGVDAVPSFDEVVLVDYLTRDVLDKWLSAAADKSVLLRITYAHRLLDAEPEIFRHAPAFPWVSPYPRVSAYPRQPIQIAVHIRRGELFLVDSDRMLPNEYYYEVMKQLHQMFSKSNQSHQFTIYTEQPTKRTEVSPQHPGIWNRFEANKVISPEQTDLSMFMNIPNTRFKINTDPFETFIEMVNSDILVCSLSSFSYTAALLKKEGHVLIPKKRFWHGSMAHWLDTV